MTKMRQVGSYVPGIIDSSVEEREQRLTTTLSDHQKAIEGELELPGLGSKGNVKAELVHARFHEADVDVSIPHGLGRAPAGVFAGPPDTKAARIYSCGRAHDDKYIYLRSDIAGVQAVIFAW